MPGTQAEATEALLHLGKAGCDCGSYWDDLIVPEVDIQIEASICGGKVDHGYSSPSQCSMSVKNQEQKSIMQEMPFRFVRVLSADLLTA